MVPSSPCDYELVPVVRELHGRVREVELHVFPASSESDSSSESSSPPFPRPSSPSAPAPPAHRRRPWTPTRTRPPGVAFVVPRPRPPRPSRSPPASIRRCSSAISACAAATSSLWCSTHSSMRFAPLHGPRELLRALQVRTSRSASPLLSRPRPCAITRSKSSFPTTGSPRDFFASDCTGASPSGSAP